MEIDPQPFRIFLKLTRPHFLLIIIGQIFLGAGIAQFQGYPIDWTLFGLGFGWLVSFQLGIQYLIQYYDRTPQRINNIPQSLSFYNGLLGDRNDQLPRDVALIAAAGMLTITSLFTLGIAQFGGFSPPLSLLMGVIVVISFAFVFPSVNLMGSGHGEWVIAMVIGALIPGFSYLIHTGSLDRLLAIITMPLVLILLPIAIALEFPNYATHEKFEVLNLLQRLGWRNAMSLHNAFLLAAFLLFVVNAFGGYPSLIALSPFFAFPLGLLQIWQMRRIADGLKPNWPTLTWNAVVIFALLSYTLALSFWLN